MPTGESHPMAVGIPHFSYLGGTAEWWDCTGIWGAKVFVGMVVETLWRLGGIVCGTSVGTVLLSFTYLIRYFTCIITLYVSKKWVCA